MSSSGAYLVSDLPLGKPCRIACRRCDRHGSYPPRRLAEQLVRTRPALWLQAPAESLE